MSARARARCRKALCAAAVTAFSVAALPAPASADDAVDSSGLQAPELVTPPGVDAVLSDVVAGAIDDADAALSAAEEITETEEPTELDATTDDSGAPAAPGTETASTGASEPDTTVDNGDTVADSTGPVTAEDAGGPATGTEAPSPATPLPVPQAGAVNVNVSVRIGSAGDNGAVTQLNAVTAPSAGASSTGSSPSRLAESTTAPVTTPSPSNADAVEWYWQWDCVSVPTLPLVSPDGTRRDSLPSTWTWIWNCGSNSEQYQENTSDQYHQTNTNVSIRISSPGDDGAVTQTNVALPGVLQGALPSLPSLEAPGSIPAIALPSLVGVAASIGVTIPSLVVDTPIGASSAQPPIALPADVTAVLAWADPTDDILAALAPRLGLVGLGAAPELALPVLLADPVALIPRSRRPLVGVAGRRPNAAEPVRWTPGSPTSNRVEPISSTWGKGAFEHGKAPRAEPARRGTPNDGAPEPRAPSAAPAGPTASAAGAGGSSGGGLPIYIVLPFVAAMLDLARRVALERAAWPSGHRRRVPDTPG